MKHRLSNRSVRAVCFALIALLLLGGASLWLSITGLTVTEYAGNSPKLTEEIRLALLCDVHNNPWLLASGALLNGVRAAKPDLILLAGDLMNFYAENDEDMLTLIRALAEVAPVYAATGNHDLFFQYTQKEYGLYQRMQAAGAVVLNNRYADVTVKGQRLRVGGLYDYAWNWRKMPLKTWRATDTYRFLTDFENTDSYKLLLCHKPEFLMGKTVRWDIDLALCGHEHGGQVRLPILGGFFSTHLGWFSPYLSGAHLMNGVPTVISRGLGTYLWNGEGTFIPPRFWNTPELAVVTVKPEEATE